jgi:hypothetical protein
LQSPLRVVARLLYNGSASIRSIRPYFKFFLQITTFSKWSRGDSNPCPPPCKVRVTFAATYRKVPEMRFREPNSALDGSCGCRQVSSLIVYTAATLLPIGAYLAESSPLLPPRQTTVRMCPRVNFVVITDVRLLIRLPHFEKTLLNSINSL